jgi:predicted RNase H-like HicB family nuclease
MFHKQVREGQTHVFVLCKFWPEDGVWNGIAEDLPVAVFGETFEEAKRNLADALESHLSSVMDSGEGDRVVKDLQSRARDYLCIDEIPLDSALLKMLVAVKSQENCVEA